MGSLQVRIGGLGNRASTEKRDGSSPKDETSGAERFLNRPFFCWVSAPAGANSCWRRAYVSSLGLPVRGGSIGRKGKSVIL